MPIAENLIVDMLAEWRNGKVINDDVVDGFRFTETAYLGETVLDEHSHEFTYFCLVTSGQFTESYDYGKQVYGKSALIFRPANEVHSNHFHVSSSCFRILLDSARQEQFDKYDDRPKETVTVKDEVAAHLVIRLMHEIRENDEYTALVAEGLILELIGRTLRKFRDTSSSFPPYWLRKVKQIIDHEFEEPLSISTLGETVSIHPNHLAREFRRYYKKTIGEYLRQQRVENSCQQLISTDATISEIAIENGFFDQSHFTRIFRKVTGMTPGTYRKAFNRR